MKASAALTRFWVKRPLFFIAIGMVAIIILGIWQPGFEWLAALAFSVLIAALNGWKTGLGALGFSTLVLANFHWRENRQTAAELWINDQGLTTIEARIVEDAVGTAGNWSAVAKIHDSGLFAKKVKWIGSGEPAPAGTEFRATGVFRKIKKRRNPGAINRAEWMRAEGIAGSFQASEMRIERWIGPVSAKLAKLKSAFRSNIIAGLDEESTAAMVIRAVVLGEKSPDSLGLVRDFRESGTLHVFTVSGLHVAMVGSIIWLILKRLSCPRSYAIPLIITAMFGYAWLTGSGPAAIRAACMGAVFLGAFTLKRRTELLNALGVVLLLSLLWNPSMIRLPGVQLSYGVVAAIGLGAWIARRCFDWIAEKESLLPRTELSWWKAKWLSFREKLAEGFAVSLAASIGSAPLAAFHFGILTPISVLATVALVAQVYVLLTAALISAMIHPFVPNISAQLNRGNAYMANACAKTAGTFAAIPGAWAMTNQPKTDTLVIYDLDYGAEAACFASENGNAILIDSGGKFHLRGVVGPSLKKLGMNPDSVIFTHSDSGHVAPAELMDQVFPIRQVSLGMPSTRGSIAESWQPSGKFETIIPKAGDILPFGSGVHAEILLSPHQKRVGSVADDQSMVLMLHWKNWNILWLGDAGRLSEQELLKQPENLKADLIVAGFHETDFSLTESLLEAVQPKAIVVPRVPGSRMDHFRSDQQKKWQSAPFKVIDRQQTGGLTLTIDDTGDLLISGFLDKSELRLNANQ
ncbi:MAG: ComEC/Rec2 family competence protein [Akkermansiaceae bacterium]